MVPIEVTPAEFRPLRVALALESDGPGGAEFMLLQLAEALRRRGHWVLHVGPSGHSGWLGARFRERGFESAAVSHRRMFDRALVREVATLLRDRRIDVMHSHEFAMSLYGAAAAASAGARHVITMHGGRYYAERWRRRAALRWAARRSAALVAVSGATAADLARTLGLSPRAVTVVPNGIEFRSGDRSRVRRELGVTDEPLIVAIGNLYPVKGHIVLLRALALLAREAPSPVWHLAIAGRGDQEAVLREFARASGLEARVHLLGFRDDVPDILAAADVFAMPSYSEGLPLALVEAMAASLPIVASDVGGIPEVVERGREALLVPPGEEAPLAAALAALFRDAALSERLAAAARQRAVREFAVDAMAVAYERLYRGQPARRDAAGPAGVPETASVES